MALFLGGGGLGGSTLDSHDSRKKPTAMSTAA